jgi:hypothetical protein
MNVGVCVKLPVLVESCNADPGVIDARMIEASMVDTAVVGTGPTDALDWLILDWLILDWLILDWLILDWLILDWLRHLWSRQSWVKSLPRGLDRLMRRQCAVAYVWQVSITVPQALSRRTLRDTCENFIFVLLCTSADLYGSFPAPGFLSLINYKARLCVWAC